MELFCNSNSDVIFSDKLFQLEEEIKKHTIKYIFNNTSDNKNCYGKNAIKEKMKNKITNKNNAFNEKNIYSDDESYTIKDLESKYSNNTSNLEIIEYPINEISNNRNSDIDNILIPNDQEYLNNQNKSNLFNYLKENRSSNYLDLFYEDNNQSSGLNQLNKEINEEKNSSKSDEVICSYIEIDNNNNSHFDINKKSKNIIKSPSKIFNQIFKNNSESIAVINKSKQKISTKKSARINKKRKNIKGKKNKKLVKTKKIEENTSGLLPDNFNGNNDNNNDTTCLRKSTNKSFKFYLDSNRKINNFKSLENPVMQSKKYLKIKKTNLKFNNNFILTEKLTDTCNTIHFDNNAEKEKNIKNKDKNKDKNKNKINSSNSVNNKNRHTTNLVNNNNLNSDIISNNNINNNVYNTFGNKSKKHLIKSFWNEKRKKYEKENKKFFFLKKNLLSSILKNSKKINDNYRIKSNNNKLKSSKIPINTFQSNIIKSVSKLKKENKNIFKENNGSRKTTTLSPKSFGKNSQNYNKNLIEKKDGIKGYLKNLNKKLDYNKVFIKNKGCKTMKRNTTDVTNKPKKILNYLSYDSNLNNINNTTNNKDKSNNSIFEANFHIYNIKTDNLIILNSDSNKNKSGSNSRKKSGNKKENKNKIKFFGENLRTQSLIELKNEEISLIDAKRNTNSTETRTKESNNYKTKNSLNYFNNIKSLKYNNFKKIINVNYMKKIKI